jgi:hypothetical protein
MATRVRWRGKIFDPRTVLMLKEAEAISKVKIVPTQGSFSRGKLSAGTHGGAGAVDISVRGLNSRQIDALTKALRQVGFAAWSRTRADGFSPHIHAIAIGAKPLPRVAAGQVVAYKAGRNGLASRSKDRQAYLKVPFRTWEQYLKAKKAKRPVRVIVRGGVILANIQKGKKNADVKALQFALRAYLKRYGYNIAKINPGGVTGFYGSETERMVNLVNDRIAKVTGNPAWASNRNDRIGRAFATRVGLKVLR